MKWSQRLQGRLTVSACVGFIVLQYHAVISILLPRFKHGPMVRWVASVCYFVSMANIFVDYFRVCNTNPGHPTDDIEPQSKQGTQWCTKCAAAKPPRAHHCRICGRCVLKMDHHCVFTNNCIGLDNYRYFVYLLVDVAVGNSMVTFVLFPRVYAVACDFAAFARHVVFDEQALRVFIAKEDLYLLFLFVTGTLSLCLVVTLLLDHVRLLLCNVTTIEDLSLGDLVLTPLPAYGSYDKGAMANVEDVFGVAPTWCKALVARVLGALRCLLIGEAPPFTPSRWSAMGWLAEDVPAANAKLQSLGKSVDGWPAEGVHEVVASIGR